jgi:hypothetical protein
METSIKWQDPPGADEPGTPKVAWAGEAAAFVIRRGEWGILTTYPLEKRNAANVFARAVRKGFYEVFAPAGDWDAKTATELDSEGVKVVNIYVKYLGE